MGYGSNISANITTKRNGIKRTVVWLFDGAYEVEPKADVVEYVQSKEKGKNAVEFLSLSSDLTVDNEELFEKFEKQTKYEIRRISKETPQFSFEGCRAQISDASLKHFVDDYNEFASTKGLEPLDAMFFLELKSQNKLILSMALLDDQPLVYHVYVCDGEKARLLYSISMYRKNENVSSNKIGMLNRWLHWQDMLALKEQKYCWLDWGGISYTNAEIANITKFKKEFGGEEWCGYSYVKENWKGKVYRNLVQLVNKIVR